MQGCAHQALRARKGSTIHEHGPEQLAGFITSLEVLSANGSEDRMNNVIELVTGRPPQKFDAWVEENKAAWQ